MAKKMIVLVDDDYGFRKALQRVLRQHGFEVAAFASAEEFQASGSAADPSCFVLDVNLTGMSGITLGHMLRSRGSGIPVVFITAEGDEATRAAANNAGCAGFLEKPFPVQRLVDVIIAAA